jgi:hypothetical protein
LVVSTLACSSDDDRSAQSSSSGAAGPGGSGPGGGAPGGSDQGGAGTGGDVPSWTPPYELPDPGETVDLAGGNAAVDVKPPAHSDGSWQYSLFQAYGGGSFSVDYSPGGAYVLASTGGHGAPPNFGAAIFDFTTGMWSYLPNANGFDEGSIDEINRVEDTNDAPYLELTAVTTPGMPSPGHNYQLQISPAASALGGSKGAVLKTAGAAQTTEAWDSPQSHTIDLSTGLWSRAAGNLVTDVYDGNPYTDAVAAHDPATNRVYLLLGFFGYVGTLPYLDLADSTWKTTESFSWPDEAAGYVRTMFVDDERRLLVVVLDSEELWAFDLNDTAAGPVRLQVSGAVSTLAFRWSLYPKADGGDGSYYAFSGKGPLYTDPPYPLATEQALDKLTPPESDPLTGVWTASKVEITGGLTAQYVVDSGSGAFHHTRFFYVPSIRAFAWIPNGTGAVELVKPP